MNRKEKLLDIYSDGGEWKDFEPVIDEMEKELATLRAQLAEASELISEARLELEHAVYPIPPSESVCTKLTAYLQKVISA